MIDTDRMTDGAELAKELGKGEGSGIPWMVILDGDGKEVVSSNAEPDGGNIGGPRSVDECAWFVEMLKRSCGDKVSAAEVAAVQADLEDYSKPKRRPRKPR